MSNNAFVFDDQASYLDNAKELIKYLPLRQITVSSIQRHLHIGYPSAARLMDELEGLGLVGKLHAWERAPRDLDADWICANCYKLDMGEIPDPSRTCRGSVCERIEQVIKLAEGK